MTQRRRRWPARVVTGFLLVKVGSLLVNVVLFPTLGGQRRGRLPPESGRVALLVPMRDEAARLRQTVPGVLTSGAGEIVYLDDESTDGSAGIVQAMAAGSPEVDVRVVSGRPRPPGWAGKTWACAQLADATDADLLIYVDADVELRPGVVDAVVAEMNRQQAAVFSVFPRQLAVTWAERLLTPLITDVVLCFLPFPLLQAPAPAAATASGALLAFRREAYDALGGFAAVRAEVVEDVAMARRTRRSGLRLGLALGGDLVAVRMYQGYHELISGLGRGLVPVAGGRTPLIVGFLWHVVAYTVPVLLAGTSRGWRWCAALGVFERIVVEAKTGGNDWSAAVLVAGSPLAAIPVVRQALRRRQSWKGRQYR